MRVLPPNIHGGDGTIGSAANSGPGNGTLDLFQDVYVWLHIQRVIANWSQDVRNMSSDLPSLCYPTAKLGNPGLVAYLLRVYIWDMVQGAFPPRDHLPVGGHAEWVPIPHTSFCAESGLFSRHAFGWAQAKCLKTAGVTTM